MLGNLLKLVIGFGLSGWWLYAFIAAAAFGGGTYTGIQIQYVKDAPVIVKAQMDAANAKIVLTDVEKKVAEAGAETARNVARANQMALDQQTMLNQQINALKVELSKETGERQRQTQLRLEALRNVPQTDTSPLGPAARNFYDGLRKQQTAANP